MRKHAPDGEDIPESASYYQGSDGKSTGERPQVWAIYKEVQRYYDMGLRVPDDVIMLLSDDNWGDVRRLPDAKERKRSGGWGMYYHVDYGGGSP